LFFKLNSKIKNKNGLAGLEGTVFFRSQVLLQFLMMPPSNSQLALIWSLMLHHWIDTLENPHYISFEVGVHGNLPGSGLHSSSSSSLSLVADDFGGKEGA